MSRFARYISYLSILRAIKWAPHCPLAHSLPAYPRSLLACVLSTSSFAMDIKLIAKLLMFVVFAGSGLLFKGWVAFRPTREASFGSPRRPPAGFRWLRGRPSLHQNSQNPSPHPHRRQSGGFVATLPRQSQVQHAPARQAQLRIGGQDQPRPPVGLLGMAHPWATPPERLLEKAERVLQVEASYVGA